jgi:hypothetical protein
MESERSGVERGGIVSTRRRSEAMEGRSYCFYESGEEGRRRPSLLFVVHVSV